MHLPSKNNVLGKDKFEKLVIFYDDLFFKFNFHFFEKL